MRISSPQYSQAEYDPIPGEHREVVAADVAQEPANTEERRDEGGNETDAEQAEVMAVEQLAVLDELVGRRSEQHGHRQEERELGGSASRQAEEHPTDNGRSGAGGTWNERESLSDSHLERIRPTHLVHSLNS